MASTSLPPRAKPWETAAAMDNPASSSAVAVSSGDHASGSGSGGGAPELPDRPGDMQSLTTTGGMAGGMNAVAGPSYSQYASPYGGAGATGYSGYGGYGASAMGGGYGGYGVGGGYGSYSSPYSRLGGMGGGYGGGYGMGTGYGVGGMGVPGEPYGPPSLSSSLQNTTRPAFAMIESLVGAFTSVAHLLESTYMATHSSFFAMVSVADQLGGLKSYLGQVLGVFSVLRLARRLIAWLRGERRASAPGGGWADEWVAGIGKASAMGGQATPGGPPPPRPSSKPLILFLVSAFGLPYLMSKLIRVLTRIQEAQAQAQGQAIGPNGERIGGGGIEAGLVQGQVAPGASNPNDMPKGPITFARALYAFDAGSAHELSLKRDEIVAILQRYQHQNADGQGQGKEMGWWRGRTRDGRVGWFPGNYVEILRKKETKPPDTPEGGSEKGHAGEV